MWLFQNTAFGCLFYLLVSGWRRATLFWPCWKTSSLIRAEWWLAPKKCKLYERTLLLLISSVALQHNLHFVQYIMPLLQNMLICDILLTYWVLKTLILTFMGSLVYVMVCRYCLIILMKAKPFPQLSQVVDVLPLAMELFAVPTCSL